MGHKDTLTKEYISRNDIFADIFNYVLHQGYPVIQPQQLLEKDITEIALPMGKDGKMIPVQRYRDILKALVIKETCDTIYAILGIENQSFVHYAMPVKNLFFKIANLKEDSRASCTATKLPSYLQLCHPPEAHLSSGLKSPTEMIC